MSSSAQDKVSFSTLPAELRVKILRNIIPTNLFLGRGGTTERPYSVKHVCRCLTISKVFRFEAASILCSENQFWPPDGLYGGVIFLRKIGKVNCSYIKHLNFGSLRVEDDEANALGYSDHTAEKNIIREVKKACPRLTCLSIGNVNPMSTGGWEKENLKNLWYMTWKYPRLVNIYYTVSYVRVVMSAEPMDEVRKVTFRLMRKPRSYTNYQQSRHRYSLIDIDGLLESIRDEAKAKRSAVAKKAAAT